jgi:hypothetical protein
VWRKETEQMKSWLKYFTLWVPFLYAMAMSGIALFGWSRSTISFPAGLPAFVAFLPMAFFFTAISTQSHLSNLERRIESLEKNAGPRTDDRAN